MIFNSCANTCGACIRTRAIQETIFEELFKNMYLHLRKYVLAPSLPPSEWMQWLYSHTVTPLMPIHQNILGELIRSKHMQCMHSNTGRYPRGIIYFIDWFRARGYLPGRLGAPQNGAIPPPWYKLVHRHICA